MMTLVLLSVHKYVPCMVLGPGHLEKKKPHVSLRKLACQCQEEKNKHTKIIE